MLGYTLGGGVQYETLLHNQVLITIVGHVSF